MKGKRPKQNQFDHVELVRRSVSPDNYTRGTAFEVAEGKEGLPRPSELSIRDVRLLRLTARALSYDSDPHVRWKAIDTLGFYGTKADRPIAIKNLTHRDETVRICSIEFIGLFCKPGDEKYALNALNDDYYAVRKFAAIALNDILKSDSIPCLVEHLKTEQSPDVQIEIYGILATHQVPGGWAEIIQHYKETGNARVSDQAKKALENLQT